MAIPSAVTKQVERSEALLKHLQQQNEGNTPAQDTEQHLQPQAAPPAVDAANHGNPAPIPVDDLQHRYNVLEGKYRAEVPRLSAENRELRDVIQAHAAEINTLKTQLASQASRTPTPDQGKFVEQVREDLGDDIAQVVEVLSSENNQLRSALTQMQSQLASVSQAVQETSTQTATQQLERDLTAMVSDWKAINVQQQFVAWLEETDALSGRTYQQLLDDAAAQFNAPRIAAIFNSYKRIASSAAPTQPTPAANYATRLEPSVTGSSVTPVNKPTYRVSDITKHANERVKGLWRGREVEWERINQEMTDAAINNRLIRD